MKNKKHSNRLLRYRLKNSDSGPWYYTGPNVCHTLHPSQAHLVSYSEAQCQMNGPGLIQYVVYELLSEEESSVLVVMDL